MGSGEAGTPTKTPKTPTSQEQAVPPSPYPEWAAAFQAAAFYNAGATPPPGYFPASGPQPHPYMWAGQPMMPPYGTPPYVYPHYGHPSLPPGAHPYGQYALPLPGTEAAGAAGAGEEGKSSDGKEHSPGKKSKEGAPGSKGNESGKPPGSANGMLSQSGDSGSEGSSEGSEEDTQKKRAADQSNTEGGNSMQPYPPHMGSAFVQPGMLVPTPPNGMPPGRPPVGTNLHMGMEYWAPTPPVPGKGKRNSMASQAMVAGAPNPAMMGPGGREGVPSELWLQDERELKRQRRKQSNRESARRSRLRKQAECEELGQRVDTLTVENMSLRTELNRLLEERTKLAADNASLLEQLHKLRGDDVLGGQEHEEDPDETSYPSQLEENGNGAVRGNPMLREGNGRVEEKSSEATGKVASGFDIGRPEAVAAS